MEYAHSLIIIIRYDNSLSYYHNILFNKNNIIIILRNKDASEIILRV